jgi:hypothetical protein
LPSVKYSAVLGNLLCTWKWGHLASEIEEQTFGHRWKIFKVLPVFWLEPLVPKM